MTILPTASYKHGLIPNRSRLPRAPHELTRWLQNFVNDVDSRECAPILDPIVQDLKDLIHSKANFRMWASAMFEEVPNKLPYNKNLVEHRLVRGYDHMLNLFSVIVNEVAPTWKKSTGIVPLMGVPFQAVLDWPMGTPSGHAFFLSQDVNEKLKIILDTWRDRVLKTSKSQGVITTDKDGWLCEEVYLSQVATRAIIFIQAPEPVGLMCNVQIGTADVSTCEIASKFTAGWPQPVRKGDEIGMFRYGGSSHCLLFRKGVHLAWVEAAIPGNRDKNLPIRSALALVYAAGK